MSGVPSAGPLAVLELWYGFGAPETVKTSSLGLLGSGQLQTLGLQGLFGLLSVPSLSISAEEY